MELDEKNRHLSEKEIINITKSVLHKTFGNLGLDETYNLRNKGGMGGFVEEFIFGYKANTDDNPDFIDAQMLHQLKKIKTVLFHQKNDLF